MYRSPIEIYTENTLKEIVKQRDGYIFQEVQRIGVNVDKEELIRALKYDRDQYNAGYADGKRDAVVHGRWLYDSGSGKYFCSSCNEDALSFKKDTLYGGDLYEVCLTDYCSHCGAKMDLEAE